MVLFLTMYVHVSCNHSCTNISVDRVCDAFLLMPLLCYLFHLAVLPRHRRVAHLQFSADKDRLELTFTQDSSRNMKALCITGSRHLHTVI